MKRFAFCRIAGLILATAFFSSAVSATSVEMQPAGKTSQKVSRQNSFSTPDFAFPQTVESNARLALGKAEAEHDYIKATKALVQISIARNSVSRDSVTAAISMIEERAKVWPAPYSSLLRMLEADMFAAAANNYRYSGRNVPLDNPPADMNAWSRDVFAMKITRLVHEATADKAALASVPLSTVSALLDCADEKNYPSLYDFLAVKGAALLSGFVSTSADVIPFGAISGGKKSVSGAAEDLRSQLVQSRLEINSSNPAAYSVAYLEWANLQPRFCRYELLMKKASEPLFVSSPYKCRLLAAAMNYLPQNKERDNRREYLAVIDKAIARFPDSELTNELKNIRARLTEKRADVSFSSRYVLNEPIRVNAKWSNMSRLYIMLYKVPYPTGDRNLNISKVLSEGKRIAVQTLESDLSVPFDAEGTVAFPGQPYGCYVVLASSNPDRYESASGRRGDYVSSFLVSDLALLGTYGQGISGKVYVVDGHNQKPLQGVKVTATSTDTRKKTVHNYVSDKDGAIALPKGAWTLRLVNGQDRLRSDYYGGYYEDNTDREQLRGSVYTALGLYHPGDSVRFAVITYISDSSGSLRKAPGCRIKATLMNSNWERVDTLALTTDSSGRAESTFRIPADGLLGRFIIRLEQGDKFLGNSSFEVAAYKAPAFYVECDSVSGHYALGDTVKICGKALTYSGMPLAGASVKYSVRYVSYWLRWMGEAAPDASYGGEALTGADGRFCIELPTSGLKDSPFARGSFSLTAEVTDAAGETQASSPVGFSLGEAYRIVPMLPDRIDASRAPGKYEVRVNDIMGNNVSRAVSWRLVDSGKQIRSGEFMAPNFSFDVASLPSGRYTIEFTSAGADSSDEVIIWRSDDKKPPVETALWLPQQKIVAQSGAKHVDVPFGSAYADSWVLCQVSEGDSVIDTRWMKVDACNTNLRVVAPKAHKPLSVIFAGMHDLKGAVSRVTVTNPSDTLRLHIRTVSFRDKLISGSRETWRFSVDYGSASAAGIPVLGVLYNHALDAIAPFSWNIPESSYPAGSGRISMLQNVFRSSNSFPFSSYKWLQTANLCVPEFNTYGMTLVPGIYFRMSRMATGLKATNEMKSLDSADKEVVEESAMTFDAAPPQMVAKKMEMGGEEDSGSQKTEGARLRTGEHPLAFFRPLMVSGHDGSLDISFDVPDFNTTWKLMLASYTPDFASDMITMEAVSSKPVMAQTNAPRFLRSGDDFLLKAVLFNATDSVRDIAGVMEVFEPLSGKVIARKDFEAIAVSAKGSRVVEIKVSAPEETQMLAFRVVATSGDFSDGEQTWVNVLPASSPVWDSNPFYMDKGDDAFSLQLPDFRSDSRITFEYCANPLWLCATSLPELSDPKDVGIISLVYSLYGNAITDGLAKRYPQIREAIAKWRELPVQSSPLVSELSKDEALKNVALSNTPWVNDAASQTLRMERLSKLLDAGYASGLVKSQLEKLKRRQSSDGGWAWCEGMQSSEFITAQVALRLGWLNRLGYLPAEGLDLARKGIDYTDARIVAFYTKHPRLLSASSLTDYLYMRSSFKGLPESVAFTNIKRKAVKLMAAGWRSLGISDAAHAAVVLHSEGYPSEARSIMESLGQKAAAKPGQGSFYDNASPMFRLLDTAAVLEAYGVVNPASPMVDSLRQWILMSRRTQTMDWRELVEVINALLTSGSDWTEASEVNVTLGDKPLALNPFDSYTGSCLMQISPAEASGKKLEVSKQQGTPAWGGIMAQYSEDVERVKAASVADLAIEKSVLVVEETPDGTQLLRREPRVGDRIRVMITVKAGKEIEYLALTDELAAGMNPVEQLSGSDFNDGVYMYKEVRTSGVNLFIPILTKGTHVFTYDCYAAQQGTFALGMATGQSLIAPMITARSAGSRIEVAAQ